MPLLRVKERGEGRGEEGKRGEERKRREEGKRGRKMGESLALTAPSFTHSPFPSPPHF